MYTGQLHPPTMARTRNAPPLALPKLPFPDPKPPLQLIHSLFDYVISYTCGMERLTKAEEQVMHVLWKLGPAFAKDVLAAMPAPRPAITTVSTIIRILEEKGFVAHEAFGRSHRYHATISKEVYGDRSVKKLVKDYFGGSPSALISAFIEREQLDASDLDEMLKLIKDHKKKR